MAPDDFPLATDYAQSYYGIRPLRTNDALVAWTNALKIAHDDNEREGVYIHLARIKMSVGRFAEARAHLNDVTNAAFADLKHRLESSLAERENAATNPTATVSRSSDVAGKTNLTPIHSRPVLSNASAGAHQSAAFCPVNGYGPDQCSAGSSPRSRLPFH